MPMLVDVMNALCDLLVRVVVAVGPRQGAKTESLVVNPYLYFGLYLGKDVLILYPTMDGAKEKWDNVIYPAVMAQPELKALDLKKTDRGSLKTGRRWANGSALYMAGAESMAILTSKSVEVVLIDETDFIVTPKTGRSDCQDRIAMAVGRSDAYPMTRRIVKTCTVTGPNDVIWLEFLAGDQRVPTVPCPHCGERFVMQFAHEMDTQMGWPDQGGVGGLAWDGEDLDTAMKSAHYVCHFCEGKIHEGDRVDMLRDYQWDARGDKTNRIASFWWNVFYVPFWPFSKIVEAYLDSRGNEMKEKDFQIYRLVVPWVDPNVEVMEISDPMIAAHTGHFDKGVVPKGPDVFVLTADVHRSYIYYGLIGFNKSDGASFVIDEDHISVISPSNLPKTLTRAEEDAIFDGLKEFYSIATTGWKSSTGSNLITPTLVGVDFGYAGDAVKRLCRQADQRKWIPIKGWSADKFKQPYKKVRRGMRTDHTYFSVLPDRTRVLHSNADWSKMQVHRALTTPIGVPGSMTLHRNMREAFGRHLRAERWEMDGDKGGKWIQTRRDNHYLDVMSMAMALAEVAGVNFYTDKIQKKVKVEATTRPKSKRKGLDYRKLDRRR